MPLPPTTPHPRQLVKLCSGMIEAGKAYVTTNRLFVSGVRDLSQQCQGDAVISVRRQLTSDSGQGWAQAGCLLRVLWAVDGEVLDTLGAWPSHLSKGSAPQECLQRFGDSLQEMVNYHMVSPVRAGGLAPSEGSCLQPPHPRPHLPGTSPQAPPSLERLWAARWS